MTSLFRDEVVRTFAFLAENYGFSDPKVIVDVQFPIVTVVYLKRHIAIEFVLDDREKDIGCMIARVVDGGTAPEYEFDAKGLRVRQDLYGLLVRRGVRDRLFRDVGRLSFRERIPVTLEDFAAMLKQHGRDILEDSPTVLDD